VLERGLDLVYVGAGARVGVGTRVGAGVDAGVCVGCSS
jgi:hypothetical protein